MVRGEHVAAAKRSTASCKDRYQSVRMGQRFTTSETIWPVPSATSA